MSELSLTLEQKLIVAIATIDTQKSVGELSVPQVLLSSLIEDVLEQPSKTKENTETKDLLFTLVKALLHVEFKTCFTEDALVPLQKIVQTTSKLDPILSCLNEIIQQVVWSFMDQHNRDYDYYSSLLNKMIESFSSATPPNKFCKQMKQIALDLARICVLDDPIFTLPALKAKDFIELYDCHQDSLFLGEIIDHMCSFLMRLPVISENLSAGFDFVDFVSRVDCDFFSIDFCNTDVWRDFQSFKSHLNSKDDSDDSEDELKMEESQKLQKLQKENEDLKSQLKTIRSYLILQ